MRIAKVDRRFNCSLADEDSGYSPYSPRRYYTLAVGEHAWWAETKGDLSGPQVRCISLQNMGLNSDLTRPEAFNLSPPRQSVSPYRRPSLSPMHAIQ